MQVSAIVTHIRAFTTVFQSVIGAATPEQAETLTNTSVPAAIVIPMGYTANQTEENMFGVYQSVTESFLILVILSNVGDRTGLAANEVSYDTAFAALNSVFLGWRPDPTSPRGFYFVDSSSLQQDGARAYYQFHYAQERNLSDADGWPGNEIALNDPDLVTMINSLIANVVVSQDGVEIDRLQITANMINNIPAWVPPVVTATLYDTAVYDADIFN